HQISQSNVGVIVEVGLWLHDLGIRDDVSVGQSLLVVFVFLDGCLHLLYQGLGFLVVAWLLWPQRGHAQMIGHGCCALAHNASGHFLHFIARVARSGHAVHACHVSLLLLLLPCVRGQRG